MREEYEPNFRKIIYLTTLLYSLGATLENFSLVTLFISKQSSLVPGKFSSNKLCFFYCEGNLFLVALYHL
jgi:hypothetical protein